MRALEDGGAQMTGAHSVSCGDYGVDTSWSLCKVGKPCGAAPPLLGGVAPED